MKKKNKKMETNQLDYITIGKLNQMLKISIYIKSI